jgi:hypothetical protein
MSGLVSLLIFHVVFKFANENYTGQTTTPPPSPLSEFGTRGSSKNMTALLRRRGAVLANKVYQTSETLEANVHALKENLPTEGLGDS